MTDSFQYGDIIFLGLIAVFVALRLRAMLGRGGGSQDVSRVWKQAVREDGVEKPALILEKMARKPIPEDDMPAALKSDPTLAAGLKSIRAADASFSTTDFLSGARLAFEWVLDAFFKGDREKLRSLLSDERFKHFSDDIQSRGKDGLKHETTLVAVLATDITEAQMQGARAHITVSFTSEQVSVTKDAEGHVVAGDPSALDKVVDVWTFERDTSSRDPNWKIIST